MKGRKLTILGLTLATIAAGGIYWAVAAQSSAAAPKVRMLAASPTIGSGAIVRWYFEAGWFPTNGVQLVRVVSGKETSVFSSQPPTEPKVDALLPAKFRGAKLATTAARSLTGVPPVTLVGNRAPSSLSLFRQERDLVEAIRASNKANVSLAAQNSLKQNIQKLTQLRRPTKPTITSSVILEPVKTGMARGQLTLAAFTNPAAANSLGLGFTDTGVKKGQTVGYRLYAQAANGTRSGSPLAEIPSFTVGNDGPPPAPSGLEAKVSLDGKVGLRWNRLTTNQEASLGAASYRISRSRRIVGRPAITTVLTEKPLVILDSPDNEPIDYFVDPLSEPGMYEYSVQLVDGFGRASAAGSLLVAAPDWRIPTPPEQAGSATTFLLETRLTGSGLPGSRPGGPGAIPPPPLTALDSRLGIEVWWQAPPSISGVEFRYIVRRTNLDSANPTAETVLNADQTSQILRVTNDQELLEAAKRFRPTLLKDEAEALAAAAEAAKGKTAREAAIIQAKARARNAGLRKALINAWTIRPLHLLKLNGAEDDKKYAFTVSAIVRSTARESAPTSAGILQIPSGRQPGSAGSLASAVQLVSGSTELAAAPAPTAGAASNQPRALSNNPPASAGYRGVNGSRFRVSTPRPKLRLTIEDYGADVRLRWISSTNLVGTKHQILRRTGSTGSFVEIGLADAGKSDYLDRVPRAAATSYFYRIVPLSRWGVKGPAAELTVAVPNTLAPLAPNILSAKWNPTAQKMEVTIARPSPDQEASTIEVRRGTAVAGAITVSGTAPFLVFQDQSAPSGATVVYSAVAKRANGLTSAASPGMEALVPDVTAPAIASLSARLGGGRGEFTGIQLNWPAPQGAASVLVKRRLAGSNGRFVSLITLPGNASAYLDYQAMGGAKTYEYQVTAVDAAGNVSAPASASFGPTP